MVVQILSTRKITYTSPIPCRKQGIRNVPIISYRCQISFVFAAVTEVADSYFLLNCVGGRKDIRNGTWLLFVRLELTGRLLCKLKPTRRFRPHKTMADTIFGCLLVRQPRRYAVAQCHPNVQK